MSTITSLSQTSSEEVRQLLEMHGIIIKKAISNRFDIICPSCEKSEAYIYFNEGSRTIKCNRGSNCGIELELWHYIADKQGIDPSNNFEMLKYINEILGHEFKQEQSENYNAEREERNKEQKFLTDCNQIFFNALNNSKDDDRVAFALTYLQQRGYTEEYTKQCGLGFFPDRDDLLNYLTQSPYSYSTTDAEELTIKYFSGVLKINNYQKQEEAKNRITFAWYDHKNNISGFSIRKASSKDLDPKYINSNELKRGELLFNLNNLKEKRELVIVEGMLDALTPNYFATEEVKQKYHFIATGQNSITEKQIQLLKNKGYSQVILLLDRDKAGENFLKSGSRLREAAITPFIALIPEEYQVKDVDELVRSYPEVDLQTILDSARYGIVAEVEQIIKSHNEAKNNLDRDKATRACLELRFSLLMSEQEPYRKIMYEKLGVRVEDLEKVTKQEQTTSTTNSGNIRSEIEKLKSEIQLKIQEIEEGKHSIIDIHEFRKKSYEIQKLILKNNIAANKDDNNSKKLRDILANIEKYNTLLTVNYDNNQPYSWGKYVQEIRNNPIGLKTGFRALDQHITIQPASLVFIAGRPSHGKTTMMLNMLRNMVKAYPNKAFLFYSYEEEKKAILSKIILANISVSDNIELIIDQEAEQNKQDSYQHKSYLEKLQLHIGKYDCKGCMSEAVYKAKNEVKEWVNEGRLQILDKKSNVENLSSAIIERVQASEKPIAAIFIDYVQKLNTETERPSRQQELQKICGVLLNTSQDERVKAAIILGAQANREVKSSDGFNLHNMKDAGDIEQDANLVLGVWNPLAEQMQILQSAIDQAEMKIKLNSTFDDSKEYGDLSVLIPEKTTMSATDINNLEKVINRAKQKIKNIAKQKKQGLTIKILKNRNGLKDLDISLSTCLSRFLIIDQNSDNNFDKANAVINNIQNMNIK